MPEIKNKFQEVTLEWDGDKRTIPPNRVMMAIAVVEDFVTLKELVDYTQNPGTAKFGKLSMGYAALLKFAGFQVTNEDIYERMLQMKEEDESVLFAAVFGLLKLMTPPSALVKKMDTGKKGDETEATRPRSKKK